MSIPVDDVRTHRNTHGRPAAYCRPGEKPLRAGSGTPRPLFWPRRLIDASTLSPCELFTRSQVEAWESANFLIKERDIVLFRFGWDRYYGLYPNDAGFSKDWPGLAADAAEYLVDKKVSLVGTDALSLDGFLANNEAHHILLSNDVYILENLNNLSQLPALSFVITLPLKIRDGSGPPACHGIGSGGQ